MHVCNEVIRMYIMHLCSRYVRAYVHAIHLTSYHALHAFCPVHVLCCRTFNVDEMSTGANELLTSGARLNEVGEGLQ